MKTNRFLLLLSLIVFINLWSCKSRKVQPQAPESSSRTHFINQEVSTLYLPIEISLNQVEQKVNELFKDVLYKDESFTDNGNDDLKLIVKKIKNIQIQAEGNVLKMTLPLNIWAKARQEILGMETSQDINSDAVITFNTRIDIDENWNFKTKTSDFKCQFLKEPTITMAGISLPIGGIVNRILNEKVKEYLPMVDKLIMENVPLRKEVEAVWKSTQTPMKIDDETNSWAKVKPIKLIFSPLETSGRIIKTSIGLESYIDIHSGNTTATEKVHSNPLPKLNRTKIPTDNFHIGVAYELSYVELTKMLKQNFIGYTYEDKKRKVTVTDITCYANGDNMVFKLDFVGSAEGILYASGRPAYDTTTQELFIENFDFDVNSKKALLKVAEWLLKGPFKKQLEKQMRFSLKSEFATVGKLVEESLVENTLGEALKLDCQILNMYPKDISLTDVSIKTLLIIDGKAKIRYGTKK